MNPKIEWCDVKTRRCLMLHFDEHLSEEDALKAIESITAMMESSPDERFVMVWECTRMRDYDSGAREWWQKFIKAIKSKLEAIHLISTNLVIRVGASTVGIFAGIRILTWKNLEEFREGF